MSDLQRVKKVINWLIFNEFAENETEISRKLGYTKSSFSQITNGRVPLSKKFIDKLCESDKNINKVWIMEGKGSMLKKDIQMEENQEKKEASKTASDNVLNGIPYVTQQAVAGFGNNDFSISERDVKDYYIIPMFKYLHIDFMIDVRGSSMVPKYNSGDVIACTIIRERTFIQWNKCHVIATREQGILVKRLRQSDNPECLTAVSDNKEYPPFDIPLVEITGIALVAGVIRLE